MTDYDAEREDILNNLRRPDYDDYDSSCVCPECNILMKPKSDYYDWHNQRNRYTYYECPRCGYCVEE